VDQLLEVAEETARATNRVLIPVPLVNPQIGAGFGIASVWFYTPPGSTRPWTTGVGGLASSNGSFGLGGLHQMSLARDRYRVEVQGGYARLNTNYFASGPVSGETAVGIEQAPALLEGRVTTRIAPRLQMGVRFRFLDMQTTVRDPDSVPADIDLSELENYQLGAIGPLLTYEQTDRAMNPRDGIRISGQWLFALPGLGSDSAYNKAIVTANRFVAVNDRTVVAFRASGCAASRDAPFFDLCLFGASANLRGYESGRFRDHASWAVQTELRRALGGKFGAVAFAGVGGVAPSLGEIGGEPLLPAAGMGLRYEVARDYGINLRLDVAVGRDSRAVYVSLGEAF
jgi:outer membrane protein assembly factor BamA